jgi:hypothetical protein
VDVLILNNLNIVDLDVQGRIPDVTLIKCNSIINVTGLASCRKVTINYCSSITNVSALAQVEELTLEYSPVYRHLWRTPIPAAMAKTFQGLESLGHVRDLKLAGINMSSLDLQCYKDIQKLHIHRCNNVNIPLETLNLLKTERDLGSLEIRGCVFDTQCELDIQTLKLNSGLAKNESFYFSDNLAKMPTEVTAAEVTTAEVTTAAQYFEDTHDFHEMTADY